MFNPECTNAHILFLELEVIRCRQVVYLKGYGLMGPDGRVVTPHTPFILGSPSKFLTVLAVMHLAEAGKIYRVA